LTLVKERDIQEWGMMSWKWGGEYARGGKIEKAPVWATSGPTDHVGFFQV